MEDEDFLAAVEADNSIASTEEPVAETPPEQVEKPVEPETVEPLELTEKAPEQPKPEETGHAPIAALLDERDKRKAAEARLAQLEQAQQAQQTVQMPDPLEDPEGFAAAQEARVQSAMYQMNLRYSERLAVVEHGPEKVATAKAWAVAKCDADPHFNARVASSEDPVGLAVREYEREEIASKVTPSEFEQFQAWKAAQSQLQQQAAPAAQPNQTSPTIPKPGLASAPSAGGILTEPAQSEQDMFDEVMPKR